jgi:hypothetical protein
MRGINHNINLNGQIQSNQDSRRWNVRVGVQGSEQDNRRGRSYQENEEEILFMGRVHGVTRNQISKKIEPLEHCQAEGSHSS